MCASRALRSPRSCGPCPLDEDKEEERKDEEEKAKKKNTQNQRGRMRRRRVRATPSPKYPAQYPQAGTQQFRKILGRFRRVSKMSRQAPKGKRKKQGRSRYCEIAQPSPEPGGAYRPSEVLLSSLDVGGLWPVFWAAQSGPAKSMGFSVF